MIIRTQCGDFDLSAVEPESIRLTDLLALRNVCRWGGHTIEHYSVVQHSVLVARLVEPCYFWHALLHDAPEAYIGDIPTPLKRTLHQLHEIEDRLWLAVAARFSIDPVIPPRSARGGSPCVVPGSRGAGSGRRVARAIQGTASPPIAAARRVRRTQYFYVHTSRKTNDRELRNDYI